MNTKKTSMKTHSRRFWLPAAAGLMVAAGPAALAEGGNPLNDKFNFSLGGFLLETDTTVRVDGEARGTEFDAGRDLGLQDADRFRFDGYWRMTPRQKLRLMYFDTRADGTRTIDEEIEFNDEVFPIDASVTGKIKTTVTALSYEFDFWQGENYGKQTTLRTSLVTDPTNGRLPPLTPEGQARSAERAKRGGAAGSSDSAQSRTLAERCISWGNVGPPMIPPTYYANMQIMQAADHVAIRHELMHDVRLIRLDALPHPGPGVQWMAGSSRGR